MTQQIGKDWKIRLVVIITIIYPWLQRYRLTSYRSLVGGKTEGQPRSSLSAV